MAGQADFIACYDWMMGFCWPQPETGTRVVAPTIGSLANSVEGLGLTGAADITLGAEMTITARGAGS